MLASAPAIAKGSVSEGTNPKTARSEPQASPVSAQWANGSVNDQARRIQRTAGNQAMIGILGKSPNDIGNRSGAQQPETQKLPEAVHLGLKSSAGEPLPSSIASSFSRKFQQDLRSVTVHTDAAAAEAVSGLGANAMARGSEFFSARVRFSLPQPKGRFSSLMSWPMWSNRPGRREVKCCGRPSRKAMLSGRRASTGREAVCWRRDRLLRSILRPTLERHMRTRMSSFGLRSRSPANKLQPRPA